MLVDRIAIGNVFEPAIKPCNDDLVDDAEPIYPVTRTQIAAIRAAGFRAGLEQNALVSA
jgi:hypothetical protein